MHQFKFVFFRKVTCSQRNKLTTFGSLVIYINNLFAYYGDQNDKIESIGLEWKILVYFYFIWELNNQNVKLGIQSQMFSELIIFGGGFCTTKYFTLLPIVWWAKPACGQFSTYCFEKHMYLSIPLLLYFRFPVWPSWSNSSLKQFYYLLRKRCSLVRMS